MRVQNEGAGKSSWWVVNPDAVARSAKTPRRPRAFTLDTKSYERQKRSRAAQQRAQGRDLLTRPGQRSAPGVQVVPDGSLTLDEPRDPFGLEYRTRASSFGGRLSPIDARPEPDAMDSMDSMDSIDYLAHPVRCQYDVPPKDQFSYGVDNQETLSETLADILAGDLNMSHISASTSPAANVPSQQPGYVEAAFDQSMTSYLQPVAFYHDSARAVRRSGGYEAGSNNSSHGSSSDVSSSAVAYGCSLSPAAGAGAGVGNVFVKGAAGGGGGIVNRALSVDHVVATGSMPNLSQLLSAPPYHAGTSCMSRVDELKHGSCMFQGYHRPPARDLASVHSDGMMTVKASSCGVMPGLGGGTNSETAGGGCYSSGFSAAGPAEARPPPLSQRLDQSAVARILAERPHLMGKMQKLLELKRQQLAAGEAQQHPYQPQQHYHYQQQQQPRVANNAVVNVANCEPDFQLQVSCCPSAVVMPTTANELPATAVAAEAVSLDSTTGNAFFPSDLDLNAVDFTGPTMGCDIDQVIRHELALDGRLDFMFDSLPTPTK